MSERRTIAGLNVRTSLGETLPGMFHDDDLVQRWCAGLDDVLAPIPSTLDNLWAYLDPELAPLDFVEWLAQWVGLELDQTWTVERRRSLIASAHQLHDYRGTVRGLADLIELYLGVRPEVTDPGSTTWSATPGAAIPSGEGDEIVVTVTVPDADAVDAARLDEMVTENKPAHLRHRVEIVVSADAAVTTERPDGDDDAESVVVEPPATPDPADAPEPTETLAPPVIEEVTDGAETPETPDAAETSETAEGDGLGSEGDDESGAPPNGS